MNGGLISGVAGINVPVGPAFVGVEGNVTKGFSEIDWEYGVRGRAGVRAGDSGMSFASAGYKWVNGRRARSDGRRVGKGGVSTCRSRRARDNSNKNKTLYIRGKI